MSRLLLISNGHGEDLSGALLGQALRDRGASVEALPLVGHGQAYRRMGLPVVGPTRDFSTGGLGYTSLRGRLTELRQGQLAYLLGRMRAAWCQRHSCDWVVVVGDVVPLLAAWLTRRPLAVYLVAYSSHYEGRLRLPWPCGWLLRQSRVRLLWSRDALTAADLTQQLGRPVHFVGNPFQEGAGGGAGSLIPAAGGGSVLGLLPGSRLPEAQANLLQMLVVLRLLPEPWPAQLRILAALVPSLSAEEIGREAAASGWSLEPPAPGGEAGRWVLRRGCLRVELVADHFWEVLHSSDLLLAMAGTAAEQAVGLGKPVLQLAGAGPQFTEGFAEAQRRLLGPAVSCAPGPVGAPATLQATAQMAAAQLGRLADPVAGPPWRAEMVRVALERLGEPGGTARMADALMAKLDVLSHPSHGTPSR
ncbi:MAG: lipid-A-disaccharide synthase-related protein [Cyanobacteriota bacterium]|nr:lipid-A-disaccharide synthase-related protein [Cyanobacteriota bacterium]